MDITALEEGHGNSGYYTESFMSVIDAYRTYLLNHEDTQLITIEPIKAVKWEFDFMGLAQSLGIAPQYRYATMRINGILCSTDYKRDRLSLYVPNHRVIDTIYNLQRMSKA